MGKKADSMRPGCAGISQHGATRQAGNRPTKPLSSQRDLSLAYSPGLPNPVWKSKNPDSAYDYTAKGNLVAVISNGTAVLGLGNIAAAAKPVMEGKAVLFKKFADIDGVDLEVGQRMLTGLWMRSACLAHPLAASISKT